MESFKGKTKTIVFVIKRYFICFLIAWCYQWCCCYLGVFVIMVGRSWCFVDMISTSWIYSNNNSNMHLNVLRDTKKKINIKRFFCSVSLIYTLQQFIHGIPVVSLLLKTYTIIYCIMQSTYLNYKSLNYRRCILSDFPIPPFRAHSGQMSTHAHLIGRCASVYIRKHTTGGFLWCIRRFLDV